MPRLTQPVMMTPAKRILLNRLTEQGVGYKELSARFRDDGYLGAAYGDLTLKNKINRGTFSADFFIDCLRVLRVESVQLPPLEFDDDNFAKPQGK